jgi:ligand-binding sensor domain-containing protein/serine phosphatase RsbU (regulator of sigma subunit)
MKKLVVLLHLFVFTIVCNAQVINDPAFKHLEPEQLGVKSLGWHSWDSKGIMWGIYENGIFSYNGYTVKKWPHVANDSSTILEKSIQAVFLDSKDNLWLSYVNSTGISKFNTKTGKIKHLFPDSTKATSVTYGPLTAIKEDSKGNIWLLTWGNGFGILNPATETCKTYLPHKLVNDRRDEYRNRVKDMFEMPDGRVLLAYFSNETDGYVPDFFDPKTARFEAFPLSTYFKDFNDPRCKIVIASLKISNFVFEDEDHNYWFGTYSGLIFFDSKAKTAKRITGQNDNMQNLENTRSYARDKDGYLWVGTPNSGVMVVNMKDKSIRYVTHNVKANSSIADNRIRHIKRDKDDNIWISTSLGTYSIYTPLTQQFAIAPWGDMDLQFIDRSQQRIPVNQMLVKHDGTVYITNANGITIYDANTRQVIKKVNPSGTLNAGNIFKMMSDAEFKLTKSQVNDIRFIDENVFLITSLNYPSLYHDKEDTYNRALAPDSLKVPWYNILFRHSAVPQDVIYLMKRWGGSFYKYDLKTNVIKPFFDLRLQKNFETNYSCILKSGKWLLSLGEAEFCIVDPFKKQSNIYKASDKTHFFPDSTIRTAYLDQQGFVWFGTNNGLYRFNEIDGKTEKMNSKIGLQQEAVNSMIQTKDGVWWIALDKQLIKWDPKTNKTFRFGRELGLSAGSFIGAIAQTDDRGRIYIATINGILIFDPERIDIPTTVPRLYMSSLIIKDDTLNAKRLLEFRNQSPKLNWNENFLNFEFATDQIYTPVPHHFYYRLVGLDSAWQDNGVSNKIRYTNLSHGHYVLEIKLKNVYDANSPVLKIPFQINAPFWLTWWFYLMLITITVIGGYYLIKYRERAYIRKQEILEDRIRERTAEVVAKAEEIIHQKDIIQEKNKELTDSIYYAQRIQQSILPDEQQIKRGLLQQFVFFIPKDIVSGDFYWYAKHNNFILWAVVDCTGHGVPGGFMSMLGSGLLNQIVNEELKLQPDDILNNLRDRVIVALKQTGAYGESKDGMDISLCAYNTVTQLLQFSGANNSIHIVRNRQLIELKADKQPIGIYVGDMKKFSLHQLTLQKDDCIFMSSDGYPDQFGGPKGKKFKSANLEKLFVEIADTSVEIQKQKLEQVFSNWKEGYEQLDDVCVFGVKI